MGTQVAYFPYPHALVKILMASLISHLTLKLCLNVLKYNQNIFGSFSKVFWNFQKVFAMFVWSLHNFWKSSVSGQKWSENRLTFRLCRSVLVSNGLCNILFQVKHGTCIIESTHLICFPLSPLAWFFFNSCAIPSPLFQNITVRP